MAGRKRQKRTSKDYDELAKLVGRRIRELRLDEGWQQVDLEAHMDAQVGQTTISAFETGRAYPSSTSLRKLAEAFDVEPAALFLDSNALRGRVALAVLDCSEETLRHVGKLLDVA